MTTCPSVFSHTCQYRSALTMCVCCVFSLPGAAVWTDRSGVMEKTSLSCGECSPSARTQLLIWQRQQSNNTQEGAFYYDNGYDGDLTWYEGALVCNRCLTMIITFKTTLKCRMRAVDEEYETWQSMKHCSWPQRWPGQVWTSAIFNEQIKN